MTPSGLCIGLDVDVDKFPANMKGNVKSIVDFNREIIQATADVAMAYKANSAFYEQYGIAGLKALYETRKLVGDSYFILDAKRGDIGNTSRAYANAAFVDLGADAITVSPYMGIDSIGPFLQCSGKMVYVLALTSNIGSEDFQRLNVGDEPLYKNVIRTVLHYPRISELGFVVGATHPHELAELRMEFSDVPMLIPGIGAQGGDVLELVKANAEGPALYNVGRSVVYAGSGQNFAELARNEAVRIAELLTSK
jgi:orotidine-5'-phosphate decarboxylase